MAATDSLIIKNSVRKTQALLLIRKGSFSGTSPDVCYLTGQQATKLHRKNSDFTE